MNRAMKSFQEFPFEFSRVFWLRWEFDNMIESNIWPHPLGAECHMACDFIRLVRRAGMRHSSTQSPIHLTYWKCRKSTLNLNLFPPQF